MLPGIQESSRKKVWVLDVERMRRLQSEKFMKYILRCVVCVRYDSEEGGKIWVMW